MIDKNIFMFILMGIFLFSFTSADLGDYKQGEEVSVRGDLAATSANVTIYFPNSSIAINNQQMTNSHGQIWNYSFSLTGKVGVYVYDYCDQNGNNCVENFFEITPSGRSAPNSGEGLVYFGSLTIMFFFSILFILLSSSFKVEEETRSDGNGGEVILKKGHAGFRFGFIGVSLVFALIAVLFVSVSLSELFPGFERISESFYIFLYVALATLFLIVLFVLISLIFQSIDHLNVKRGRKD